MSSIGAPIFDHSGNIIASISLSSTSQKIPPSKENEIAQLVVDAANKISAELGWMGNDNNKEF